MRWTGIALMLCYGGMAVCVIGMFSCIPGIARQRGEERRRLDRLDPPPGFTPYHPKKGKFRHIKPE